MLYSELIKIVTLQEVEIEFTTGECSLQVFTAGVHHRCSPQVFTVVFTVVCLSLHLT